MIREKGFKEQTGSNTSSYFDRISWAVIILYRHRQTLLFILKTAYLLSMFFEFAIGGKASVL